MNFSRSDSTSLTFTTLARNSPTALAIAMTAFPNEPPLALTPAFCPLLELPLLALVAQVILELFNKEKDLTRSGSYMKDERTKQLAYSFHAATDEKGFVLASVVTPGNVHDSHILEALVQKNHGRYRTTMKEGYRQYTSTPTICAAFRVSVKINRRSFSVISGIYTWM
ncbi:hypothetical protein HNO89_003640 [Sporosarcina luteola]|nr:hypothetical protein [Sporosarcina luteola]